MKQFIKKSLMLTLCAALVLLLINVTAIEARAEEGGRAWVYFETFEELKEACKETYPNGATFYYDSEEALTIKENLTLPADSSLSMYNSTLIIPKGVTLTIKETDYSVSVGTLTVKGTLKISCYLSVYTKLDVQGKITADGNISLEDGATYSGLDKITFSNNWNKVSCTTYVTNYDELKAAIDYAKDDTGRLFCYIYYNNYNDDALTIKKSMTIPGNCSFSMYGGTLIIPKDVTLTIKECDYSMSVNTLTVKGTLKIDRYLYIYNKLDVQGKITAGSDIDLADDVTYSGLDKITFTNDENHIYCTEYVANYDELKAVADLAKNNSSLFCEVYYNNYNGDALTIKKSMTIPANCRLSVYNGTLIIPKDVTLTVKECDYSLSVGTLTVKGTLKIDRGLSVNNKLDVQGKITAGGDINLSNDVTYSGLDKITFTNDESRIYCSKSVANYDALKAVVSEAKEYSNLFYSINYSNYDEALTIKKNLTIPANCSLSLYNATLIIPKDVTLTVKESDYSVSVDTLTVKGTLKIDRYLYVYTKLDVQGKITAGDNINLSDGATYSGLDKITFSNEGNRVNVSKYVANYDELKTAVSEAKEYSNLFCQIYYSNYDEALTIKKNLTIPANCILNLYDATLIIPKDVTLTVKESNYIMSVDTLTVKGTLKIDRYLDINTKLDVQGKITAGRDINLSAGATYSGLDKITFTDDGHCVSCTVYVANFDELKAVVAEAKKSKSCIRYDVYTDSSYNSVTIKENLTVPENCNLNLYDNTVTVSKDVTFTVGESAGSFYCKSLSVKGTFNCGTYLHVSKSLSVTGKLNAGSSVALSAGATAKGVDKIEFVNGWGQVSYEYSVSSVDELKAAISAAKADENGIYYDIYFYTEKSVSLSSSITIPENATLQLYGTGSFTIPSGKKLTVNGGLDLITKLTVKGTLVNNSTIYVYGTNWYTDKDNSLTFSDGKYSGNGRMYVIKYENQDADKYTHIVKSLSKTDLEVTEYGDYWILRNINGLKKLSKPKELTWGYTMEYKWNAKTEKGTYTLTKRKGDFIWNAGSTKEKGVDYQMYKICVYRNDELYAQYFRYYDNEYLSDYKNMYLDLSTSMDLKSGTYYFTVQAIAQGDDYCNSDVVKSSTWTYKKPDTKMKKASKLEWSFPTMEWSGPSGHELYSFEIYYAKTETADPVKVDSLTMPMKGEYKLDKSDLKYLAEYYGAGYYSFRVRTMSTDITKNLHASWSSMSDPIYFDGVYSLSKPSVTASNVSSSGKIELEWKKVSGAAKYQIYRATSKDGEYTKIKTTTKTSYVDETAKAGTKYYYKVRAVSESGLKSSYSSAVAKTCDLARPDVTAKLSSGKVKLTWEEVKGATKYEVYRATSKSGEYEKIKTTTSLKYTDSSVKDGKTYYYKVVAVHKNTTANSAYSSVDSVKVKK